MLSVGHYAQHVPLPALVGTPTVELDPRLYIAPPLRKQCVGWNPEWGKVRVSSVVWCPPCGLRCRGAGADACVWGGGGVLSRSDVRAAPHCLTFPPSLPHVLASGCGRSTDCRAIRFRPLPALLLEPTWPWRSGSEGRQRRGDQAAAPPPPCVAATATPTDPQFPSIQQPYLTFCNAIHH